MLAARLSNFNFPVSIFRLTGFAEDYPATEDSAAEGGSNHCSPDFQKATRAFPACSSPEFVLPEYFAAAQNLAHLCSGPSKTRTGDNCSPSRKRSPIFPQPCCQFR